ncbi:LOW QUALITY PROTEIN: cytochrome P450 2J3-like [Panulirus ornatus]|uniref:LOW QUALITY PROTEIN: cytochrome P450 2J3-like n=1 Tax=Panulirus ornatus TaxID=150431 RepID=UPI003A852A50
MIWAAENLYWAVILLVALGSLLFLFTQGGRPKNFPPGLPILPLVGSLLSMPNGPTRESFRNLKKKYGNMASFGYFDKRLVLVSGVSTMREVFSKKEASGRAEFLLSATRNYMLSEGRSINLGIKGSSGNKWQEQRRFLLHHLRDLGFGKTSYEPMIMEEVTELMEYLEQQNGQPITMKRVFNRSVVNVLWGMVMGKRYSYGHKKLQTLLKNFLQLTDVYILSPIMFLPGITKLATYLPSLKENVTAIQNIIKFIKDEIHEFIASDDGITTNCLTSLYLQEMRKSGDKPTYFDMDQMTAVIMEMFVAGMETTSSTLTFGIYMMAKHPDAQKRVQQELDQVLGNDKQPSFSEKELLPYTLAVIHEIQRTFKLIGFSLPHSALEDCYLAGYFIPKGTVLLANLDDALSDTQLWKDSQHFHPDNFLDENGKYKKNEAFLPFGIGKPNVWAAISTPLSCTS